MRTTLLITLMAVLGAALPATSFASTASFVDQTFIYDASPGEQNDVVLGLSDACSGLAAPCLRVADDVAIVPPPACAPAGALASAIVCPEPRGIVLRLGDGNDVVQDWNGPSVIDGGPGDDTLMGNGGDDWLSGGAGADVLAGGAGDDTLRTRDGARDLIACGGGVDQATVDRIDSTSRAGCENLDARARRAG